MFCGRFVLPHSCVWPSQDSKVIGCELPQYRYWNYSDRAAWTVDRSAPTVRQGYRVDCAVDETLDISWSRELISCQWLASAAWAVAVGIFNSLNGYKHWLNIGTILYYIGQTMCWWRWVQYDCAWYLSAVPF